jgi:putative ABC transport system permease protein
MGPTNGLILAIRALFQAVADLNARGGALLYCVTHFEPPKWRSQQSPSRLFTTGANSQSKTTVMHFSTFLSRNIFRRKIRSLLTTVGIAISIMAVVALLGVSDGYMQATKAQYELHSVDMVVVRAGVADRLNSSLDEHYAEILSKLPDVESVNPMLTDRVSLGKGTPGGVLVQGLPAWSKQLTALHFLEGKPFDPAAKKEESEKQPGVLLGEQLAKNITKKLGDDLNIEERPFRVEGIFRSKNAFENNAAIFLLDDLQSLMERGEQVSEFQLTLNT